MKFSEDRRTRRLPCYQPIQIFVSQENGTRQCTVINGVITNVTKDGLFIQTSSKIDKGKLFFTYVDAKSNSTLYFDCDVIRTDRNGIAVTYNLLTDSDKVKTNCLNKEATSSVRKGRFLDCYM